MIHIKITNVLCILLLISLWTSVYFLSYLILDIENTRRKEIRNTNVETFTFTSEPELKYKPSVAVPYPKKNGRQKIDVLSIDIPGMPEETR